MGGQCTKLMPCCWDSQFKAAVVEVPDAGQLKLFSSFWPRTGKKIIVHGS